MTGDLIRLAKLIRDSEKIVFFGGAGVSTESGIPDFRSAHGIYSGAKGRAYEEMLSADFFLTHREEFWAFYRNVMLYPNALPNAAHRALAKLEARGKLDAVITQNIDGLHQAAGAENVLELHGSVHRNYCMKCGRRYTLADILTGEGAPRCECGGMIRPDVVLYGETLDEDVLDAAVSAISGCDLLIVGGTSLTVYPAAGLLRYKNQSAPLVLLNRDATPYDGRADLVLRDNIAQVLETAVM